MTKNATFEESNKTTHLEKFKHFNPFDPFLGVVGFILVTCLFIGDFFYMDYSGFPSFGLSRTPSSPPEDSEVKAAAIAMAPATTLNANGRLGFLDEGGDTCDIYDGKWVWDDNYPLYQSRDCPFIDADFRCHENGRPDSDYTKWRWQPNGCDLPRFNATMMLEKLRNRRLAFIGDSLGRNQWESLLCMLAAAVPKKDSIYEVHGHPIRKHRGFLIYRFEDYNCTVEYFLAQFLVAQGSSPRGSPKGVNQTLRLDRMTWTRQRWKDADVLVFNTGHWWNYEKTIESGCYFQEGTEVKMEMDVLTAYQKSIETLIDFVANQVDTNKTQVIFRTYSPTHFRNGTWKTGGHCHELRLPDFGPLPKNTEKVFDIASSVFSKHPQGFQVMKMMNVTPMTYRRQDGHISIYHSGSKYWQPPRTHQDCTHWCLPGVPESWNEFLYALFLQREFSRSPSSTQNSQPRL